MTERTVKFGWWKGQLEIIQHDGIFSLPTFQTVRVSLGQAVTNFKIAGLASTYPGTNPTPPIFAQGSASCEVDLPAGTFVATCGRNQNSEAVGTISYKV